jgi:hypothetical protein
MERKSKGNGGSQELSFNDDDDDMKKTPMKKEKLTKNETWGFTPKHKTYVLENSK